MRLRRVGLTAVLAEVGSAAEAGALATWARGRVEALEIVPAARTVLFDGVSGDLHEALGSWSPSAAVAEGPLVEIEVVYDGPDLARVGELWGAEPAEVLAGLTLTSAFCGFAPGFAYLTGLPPARHVPRLETPRPRVPAGSVAVAGEFCGVYPTASPGGWSLLGTTSAVLWDVTRASPALLAPGTRVRFVPC